MPEAFFMVFLLDSKDAQVCKSCRSRQELSNQYLLVNFKIWRRYSRERASQSLPKISQKLDKKFEKHRCKPTAARPDISKALTGKTGTDSCLAMSFLTSTNETSSSTSSSLAKHRSGTRSSSCTESMSKGTHRSCPYQRTAWSTFPGLKIRGSSNPPLHTSTFGLFSAVLTPTFARGYSFFVVQHFSRSIRCAFFCDAPAIII